MPEGSRTVTVAPGSPLPVTTVPPPPIAAVRPSGAVMSGACTAVSGETLPAGSAWETSSSWPLACGVVRVTLKLPPAATRAVPSGLPAASWTLTVAPGSPVPVTTVPSADTLATGAAGGVMSGAVRLTVGEWLPAPSVCPTVSVPPLAWGGASGTK